MTANREPSEEVVRLRKRVAELERVADRRRVTMQTLAHAVSGLETQLHDAWQMRAEWQRRAERWKEAARFYRRSFVAMGGRRILRTWFSTRTGGTTRSAAHAID